MLLKNQSKHWSGDPWRVGSCIEHRSVKRRGGDSDVSLVVTPACDKFYILKFSLFTVLITDLMEFLMRCKDPDGAVVDLE